MDGPERLDGPPVIREVGGYRLVRVIGTGGMGTVYEAIDADEHGVALKLLHPAFSADDAARDRLRREVSTLHRVRGPHVARVLDAEADSDEAFVVTELIDGQSLEDSIREHGPMDAIELANLADGLARALDSIHGVGVVHRDLKPGNVMLTDDGPVVIDFGISQIADDARLTQTGLVTGTPGYVDPAVIRGGDPGTGGDWWGWAAVLVYSATGRPPFGRGPLGGVLARVETGRADVEGLPPRVAQVLRRSLHPDPERRMSHEAVQRALTDHAEGREVTSLLDPGQDDGAPVAAAPVHPPHRPSGRESDAPRATAVMPQDVRAQFPPTRLASVHAPVAPAPVAPAPLAPVQPPRAPTHPPVPALGDEAAYLPAPYQPQHAPTGYAAEPPGGRVASDGENGPFGWPAWAVPSRSRPGITLAWWLAAVGLGAVWPTYTLMGLAAILLVGGAVGSAARALRNRRLRHGLRRWDVPVTTLATPLHALRAVLLLVPGALVGGLAGAIVWGLTARTFPMEGVVPAVVAVVTLLCWWTPSSATAREGVRAILEAGAPGPRSTWVWILLALVTAAVAVVLAVVGGVTPDWAPFAEPPIPQF